MRTSMHVAALILALAAPGAAQQPGCDRRTISVNGRGEVKADPDLALLHFAVETTAATAAAAAEQNAQISGKVGAALKAMIAAGDKIQTTSYSLQPRYDSPRRDAGEVPAEPKIVGYIATNEVQVETSAIANAGKLIDAAIAAGANRVSNLSFTLRDRNEYVRKALDQAGAEAKAQADAAAHALNVRIKQIISATTMAPPIIQPRVYEGFGRAAMAQANTPVEPGEVSVWAELNVVYEIE